MTNRNQFYMMDKREAYGFIWECVRAWCRTYGNETGRIEGNVRRLIDNWNGNNVLGECIDYYEISEDGVNDGYCVGYGIEDEHFIFPEFYDEWNRHFEKLYG